MRKRKGRQLSLTDRFYIFVSRVLRSEVGRKLKNLIENSPAYARIRKEVRDFKEKD